MAELREISTRAEISPTRFWNEYHWGDLKADPTKLMERYFDAHLYFANWGMHRLMLRVPKARVDLAALEPYFTARRATAARLARVGEHILLDLTSETEEPEYDEQNAGSLAVLAPLRAELMRGDLRPAYLAWLLSIQAGDLNDAASEPPVPAGLSQLTAAQEAMLEFLRIDKDLFAAAVAGSAPATDEGSPFRLWLAALSAEEKDAWLRRAAAEPELALGSELLRAFRSIANTAARRTAGELRALAKEKGAQRQQNEAARAARAKAAADAARDRYLTKLGADVEAAWAKLEKLVESSRYDDAVSLAVDLRDLAIRDAASLEAFAVRFEAMRKRKLRRRGFFDRWKVIAR